MPVFDTVKYCEVTEGPADKMYRGPAYEHCVEDQEHLRILLGEAIDANKFKEADIIHCAKASRTAYKAMWYCVNGQRY